MTTNQIAYFSAKEQQRHNYAVERETGRHNVAEESHFTRMDAETLRHNLATEQQARENLNLGYAQLDLGNRQLEETQRHNYASESLQLSSLAETSRHNKASEALAADTLSETMTHNREMERMQDEVNGSVVTSNYANANKLKQDAALAAQRLETEKKQQSYISAQTALVQQKTETEKKISKYQGAKDVSYIVHNYAGSISSLLGSASKIATGFGSVGARSGASALDQLEAGFYSQLEY